MENEGSGGMIENEKMIENGDWRGKENDGKKIIRAK